MAAGGGAQVKKADLSSTELARIVFTTGSGVHAGPLSEFAVFGLLAGAKQLARLQADKAARRWRSGGRWPMGQLAGATTVILGMGHVGRETARKVVSFGGRVLGVNLVLDDPVPGVERLVPPEELLQVIKEADYLVNTLPGTDSTYHFVSSEVLSAAKPGLVVASVGRGSVFDEAALVAALKDGRVGFACLDVFEHEPLSAKSELWNLENVVISPHTASNSPDEERLLAELFVENARRFLDGEPLLNRVDLRHFF
jgi:phosphoglycerate dehydrogenase-like enzyme